MLPSLISNDNQPHFEDSKIIQKKKKSDIEEVTKLIYVEEKRKIWRKHTREATQKPSKSRKVEAVVLAEDKDKKEQTEKIR